MLTEILERDAELLKATDISHCQRHYLLLHYTLGIWILIIGQKELRLDGLLTDQLGDLNLPGQKNLKALDLCGLSPVFKEVFHTAIELGFEELFKAFRDSKLLIGIGQEADIDDW